MSYSTGEIAELCGVSVRTVQYYDREGLLKPESFSEGGRRVYGDEGLKTLQIICMYKKLGLSLTEIKDVISDEANSKKILLSVLSEREKELDDEIRQRLSQRDSIKVIREYLSQGAAMPENTFFDVQTIMKGKRKLWATRATLLTFGILLDAAEITFIVLWAVMGLWLPFAIGMPCVLLFVVALIAMYYKNVAYICTDCGRKFKPKVAEWLFSKHTITTHRVTCPHCGSKNYHTETYSD